MCICCGRTAWLRKHGVHVCLVWSQDGFSLSLAWKMEKQGTSGMVSEKVWRLVSSKSNHLYTFTLSRMYSSLRTEFYSTLLEPLLSLMISRSVYTRFSYKASYQGTSSRLEIFVALASLAAAEWFIIKACSWCRASRAEVLNLICQYNANKW